MEKRIIIWEKGWEFIQEGIAKLKDVLEEVPGSQITCEEYMMLYAEVYEMCTQKPPHDYSHMLYDKYKEVLEDYCKTSVLPVLRENHDEFVLREFLKKWTNYKVMFRWVSRFFHYLDRYYIARRSLPNLNEVGLVCFENLVYHVVKSKLSNAVISLIEKEYEGEQIDRTLLKNVLDTFIEIGSGSMEYYETYFEAKMLKESTAYFSRKASKWIQEYPFPDYVVKADECIKRKKDLVSHYLHYSSVPKLVLKLQEEFFNDYAIQQVEKEIPEFEASLKEGKLVDLSSMYSLFFRIPHGLGPVSQAFKQHVATEGTILMEEAQDAAKNKKAEEQDAIPMQEQVLVKNIIKLHDKYLGYVNGCFQNNSLFHKALKVSFEEFCNKEVGGSSIAEMLAMLCHSILKKGSNEKLSDEAIEGILEKVVTLLAYIRDKDLFAELHRKMLARRLLFGKSVDDDHEKSFLTKLKHHYGLQFTSKMEGMVTDLALSREYCTEFEQHIRSNPIENSGVDFAVTIITAGIWPSYKSLNLNLPAKMDMCVKSFEEFYQTKTNHRKLSWVFSLGTCNLYGMFECKTIELIVTTYQASALLLFNSSDRLSYTEIKSELGLEDYDLIRLLHSLSCSKYKILRKEPNTNIISHKDFFVFNSKFTDKMRRVRIPPPLMDEKKKLINDVNRDRKYAIDAAIVRIMKSRKTLSHQQLVLECIEQLSHMFKPDVIEIKRRMEDLIARDYLERDEKNPSLFKYVA